jgi:ribose transport system permease protein
MGKIKNILKFRELSLILIILVSVIILSIMFPNFFSRANIFGILYTISVNTFIVGAMTVLFVSGGFDLSVGATLGLTGMIAGRFIVRMDLPILLSIILVLLIGAAIGSFIGFIVSYININPFIVTLAAWFIIESITVIVSGGTNIANFPSRFGDIASYKIFSVPMILIISLLSLVIFDILIRKNAYFRLNFFIGGNENAALLAGINVKRVKLLNYTLVGFMAAIAGVFNTSRFMAAFVTAGSENAFQIITAVIIGGASLKGGRGSVLGSFFGLIIMALIYNALIFLRVDVLLNRIVIGAILIIAVLIDINIQKQRRLRLK